MKFAKKSIMVLALACLFVLSNCRHNTEPLSNKATLSGLSVTTTASGGSSILPGFVPAKESYNVELQTRTTKIFISATTTDKGATVTYSPPKATDGSITLPSNNVILVTVTSQDKSTTKTYTINFSIVTNQDQASLTSLLVNLVSGDGKNIIVGFTPGRELYEVEVLVSTTKIFVAGIAPVGANVTYSPTRGADNYITLPATGNLVVTVTVTQAGKTSKAYTITITKVAVRTGNDIASFNFTRANNSALTRNYIGNVGANTVTFDDLPSSVNITALIPTIEISSGATIRPESGVVANFTSPQTYTVTAENNNTKVYTVTVTRAVTGTENDIVSFNLNMVNNSNLTIDYIGEVKANEVIFVELPFGTDITALKPTIEVSQGATINPANGVETDFTNPRIYTVTSEDRKKSKEYTVTVKRVTGSATVTITSTSNEIIINSSDGFLIHKNKDLTVTITSTSQFVANPSPGIKLTAVDNNGATIVEPDILLEINKVDSKQLAVKVKAKSTEGKTAYPVGTILKITVEGHALADASGYDNPKSIELTLKAGNIWSPRSFHTSVVDQTGNIYVIGGDYKKDVWKSEDKGLTWTKILDDAGWTARYGYNSVIDSKNSMYVIGGFANQEGTHDLGPKNDVWKSEPGGVDWNLITTANGLPPNDFVTCVIDNSDNIYVLAGWLDAHRLGDPTVTGASPINDVYKLSNNDPRWSKISTGVGWAPRYLHTAVIDNKGNFYVIAGGRGDSESDVLDDVWKSSNQGVTWTNLKATGLKARKAHSSVIDDNNNIYVFGGTTRLDFGGLLNDVLTSSDGVTWSTQKASAEWLRRYAHSTVIDGDGYFYLMGGTTLGYVELNDVWKSTDKGKSWERIW